MSKYLTIVEVEIKNNIKTFSDEEIFTITGGKVHDDVNNKTYNSINEWLYDYLDDSLEDVEMIARTGYFDDY